MPKSKKDGPRDQKAFGKCMGLAREQWNLAQDSVPADRTMLKKGCAKAQDCYKKFW
jgi:hypothetical protein